MSRWGCIGQIAPGISRSSLNTRMFPNPMYSGSWYRSKEKCHRAVNHPPSSRWISWSLRMWMVIVIPPGRAKRHLRVWWNRTVVRSRALASAGAARCDAGSLRTLILERLLDPAAERSGVDGGEAVELGFHPLEVGAGQARIDEAPLDHLL